MNNSAKKWLWALVGVLIVVMIALVVLLVTGLQPENADAQLSAGFSAGEEVSLKQGEAEVVSENEPVPENLITEPENNMTIETPVCTLYYPRQWEDFLRVEMTDGEPYTVLFWAELPSEVSAELFKVRFGEESGNGLGYLTTETGERILVSVEKHELVPEENWTEEDLFILQAMQAAFRTLESNLPALEPVVPAGALTMPENDGALMTMETPWASPSYPACWAEYLNTTVDEASGTVTFYGVVGEHEAVELFTLCFGGEEGIPFGSVSTPEGDVDVLVQMSSLSFDDSWSEDEQNIIYAMREGINDLLAALE